MIRRFAHFLVLSLFVLPGVAAAQERVEPWIDATLELEIQAAMANLKTPGLGVGVIDLKNNRTYMKGFGHRDLEGRLPVTEHTLFMIGSTTKAFTATGLRLLAEQGKLKLNEPVRKILPEFELKDEVSSRLATPIDLLTHRTGLPRHDLVWYGDNHQPRHYFLSLLKHLEPSATFREKWQYNNLMFMVAGMISERITGLTWEEFTRQEILLPLGMHDTNFSIDEMLAATDYASPYTLDDQGNIVRTNYHHVGALGPAGSINSSVADMLNWLRFNLKSKQVPALLPPAAVDSLHRPQAAIGVRPNEESGHMQYALGWGVIPYRGHTWISHDGGIDGFISHVGFMPDSQLGVVVFANSDASGVPDVVAKMIYDHVLGVPKIDWLGRHLEQIQAGRQARIDEQKKIPESSTPLSRPAEDFVGQYSHAAYRNLFVTVGEEDRLTLSFRGTAFAMAHVGNGAFVAHGKFSGEQIVTEVVFQVDSLGEIESLKIGLEPTAGPVLFRKSSPGPAKTRVNPKHVLGPDRIYAGHIGVSLREN